MGNKISSDRSFSVYPCVMKVMKVIKGMKVMKFMKVMMVINT